LTKIEVEDRRKKRKKKIRGISLTGSNLPGITLGNSVDDDIKVTLNVWHDNTFGKVQRRDEREKQN
jgi:hypothetical protein